MHRIAGSCIVLASAALAATLAAGAGRAPDLPPTGVPAFTPVAISRVRATGRGHAPRLARSDAQLRLMAKRAAVVEAYKNAAKTLGHARSSVAAGTGAEAVSGFIRGVELMETRYYRDGEVEVDVEFTVPSPPAAATSAGPPCRGAGRSEGLLLVEKGRGPMGEEEWRDILGGAGVQKP